MSPIPFDSRLPKCYDSSVSSDVVNKRITEKADYPRQQRVNPKTF